MSEEWKPKPYRRRSEHRIWKGTRNWYVNYYNDPIYGVFDTWAAALTFLKEELGK